MGVAQKPSCNTTAHKWFKSLNFKYSEESKRETPKDNTINSMITTNPKTAVYVTCTRDMVINTERTIMFSIMEIEFVSVELNGIMILGNFNLLMRDDFTSNDCIPLSVVSAKNDHNKIPERR